MFVSGGDDSSTGSRSGESMSPLEIGCFYGVHLKDSTCPGFPADRSFGGNAYVTN